MEEEGGGNKKSTQGYIPLWRRRQKEKTFLSSLLFFSPGFFPFLPAAKPSGPRMVRVVLFVVGGGGAV